MCASDQLVGRMYLDRCIFGGGSKESSIETESDVQNLIGQNSAMDFTFHAR